MKTPGKSTSYRVIQLGVLSAGKVKPRQLRSSCEMDVFFTFLNQVILGNTSTQFFDWLKRPILPKKIERFCTVHLQRTKPTFWIKLFILSHELTWRQPLTLYNFSQKWMQVQNHAVASATQQWKKRSYQNVSSSRTWQWKITHLDVFPGHLHLQRIS